MICRIKAIVCVSKIFSRIVKSGNLGVVLQRLGFREGRHLSGGYCHRVLLLKHPFSPRNIFVNFPFTLNFLSAIWKNPIATYIDENRRFFFFLQMLRCNVAFSYEI